MGSVYQDEPMEVDYLPVDEAHRLTPRDPYAVGKHALEVTADGFGRLEDAPTLSSLRYPWVTTDEEMRETFREADRSLAALPDAMPGTVRNVLFSYLALDDAARVAADCVEADHDGHEAFWTVAADTTADATTPALVEEFYPDADVRREFEGHEALVDVSKAERLLGWTPGRSWRG
jgi:nucleoside-diphosphate-sugar epimerase